MFPVRIFLRISDYIITNKIVQFFLGIFIFTKRTDMQKKKSCVSEEMVFWDSAFFIPTERFTYRPVLITKRENTFLLGIRKIHLERSVFNPFDKFLLRNT